MSIDRSLKSGGALARHRNVLTRPERIQRLKDQERWNEQDSLFGLPKVANRKSHAGRKEKTAAEKQPQTLPESPTAPTEKKEK